MSQGLGRERQRIAKASGERRKHRLTGGGTPSLRRDGGAVTEAEQTIREHDEQLRSIAENLPGVVFRRLLRSDGTIGYAYASSRTREFSGAAAEDLILGRAKLEQFMHPDDRRPYAEALKKSARELSPMVIDIRFPLAGGKMRWMRSMSQPRRLENGDIQWDGISLDVTELKTLAAARDHLAYYDQLTGLPNRTLLVDRLSQALLHAGRSAGKVAVICVELESLDDIRESRGFTVANALIAEAAAKIAAALRPDDTVAHHGDGHFAAVLRDIHSTPDAMVPVRRLIETFDEPFSVAGTEVFARARIGISLYPDDADRAEELLQHANTALSRAESLSAQRYEFYGAHMAASAKARVNIESELRHALERGEIEPFYQPAVDPDTFCIIGMEALARWRHPTRGMVPPGLFIPIAEQTGLIVPLGELVLRMACAQTVAWRHDGICDFPVSVNVSGWQLMHEELADRVLAILAESGLAPSHLTLELTESTIVRNLSPAARTMEKLAAAGVSFAVDDFGIEHSALSHLSQLPIDVLKVDHSFVSRMTSDAAHAALVQGIVTMTHAMKKKAVAEGVETGQELVYLRAYRCDALQGYLFSPPVPPERFAGLLRAKTLPPDFAGAQNEPPRA